MTAHAQPHGGAQYVDTVAPPHATALARALPHIGSRMVVSRVIGGLFLLGFLS